MQKLKKLFYELVQVGSPSGFEEPMMRKLIEKIEPYTDKVYHTPRGNVIGVKRGTDHEAPKIALAAHMDQVGFIVFNIDKEGFIRFRKIGGAVNRSIQGHQVKLLTENGPVYGVVGIKPGHITKPSEANIVPPIEEMYIDIGANSREEVLIKHIKIGTPIIWSTQPLELENNYIATPAADDRAGITAIIRIAENLSKNPIPSTVYFIGTVEEEIGLRGAEVALYDLDVDMAIAIDTCPAGWQPDVNIRDMYYEIGKGPALQIGEIGSGIRFGNQVLRKWLIKTAEEKKIPYQTGLMHGGTDTSTMQQTRAGIPSVTFSIPRRYSHSPVELFNWNDLFNLTEILTHAIRDLRKGFTGHRI